MDFDGAVVVDIGSLGAEDSTVIGPAGLRAGGGESQNKRPSVAYEIGLLWYRALRTVSVRAFRPITSVGCACQVAVGRITLVT